MRLNKLFLLAVVLTAACSERVFAITPQKKAVGNKETSNAQIKEADVLILEDFKAIKSGSINRSQVQKQNRAPQTTRGELGNQFYTIDQYFPSFSTRVSPNGKYVSGGAHNGAFRWEVGKEFVYLPGRVTIYSDDVNDDGIVCGTFNDSTYLIDTVAVLSAGYHDMLKWHSLGAGQMNLALMGTNTKKGSEAEVITNNMIIGGMSYNSQSTAKIVPMVWKVNGNTIDTVTYNYQGGVQGARVRDMSADGSLACGWNVGATSFRQPIVFKNSTTYKLLGKTGECSGVSPNGKYISGWIDRKAFLYIVDKDSLIMFGEYSTYATSVSDNGMVLGYLDDQTNLQRTGFVWSQDFGFLWLDEFIKTFAPDIQLPDAYNFSKKGYFDVPMSVSADGTVLTGWRGTSAFSRNTWVLKFAKVLDFPKRPTGLKAAVNIEKRNEVTLTWLPPAASSYTLTGYKIYCDTTLVDSVGLNILTYNDTNVTAGYKNYKVCASYTGNLVSPKSDKALVAIVDNYNLPFGEYFESFSTKTNYWTSQSYTSAAPTWAVHYTAGIYGSVSLLQRAFGNATYYNEAIISKPMDATQNTNVYLSFMYKSTPSAITGISDTLRVEINNDLTKDEWKLLKIIGKTITFRKDYSTEKIDLSALAAGKLFKIRFRISGTDRKIVNMDFDNIVVSAENPKEITEITSYKTGNYRTIEWKEPSGSYGLTYEKAFPKQTIGDEGVPFIAVNKFDSTQLKQYSGSKLTSISAFINQTLTPGAGIKPTKLKLAVFVDSVRVCNDDVTTIEPNKWNTFKLATPITIPTGKSMSFGIDVVQHDAGEFPLCTDWAASTQGKSDLFSEDGGLTWGNLTSVGFAYNWSIIGNVRIEASSDLERTTNVMGYEIFRDNFKINSNLCFGQNYTDSASLATSCYTVKAVYLDHGNASLSPIYCLDKTDLPNVVSSTSIHPNPVYDVFYIKDMKEAADLLILDMKGASVLQQRFNLNEGVNVSILKKGVYIVRLNSKTNTQTYKLIKL